MLEFTGGFREKFANLNDHFAKSSEICLPCLMHVSIECAALNNHYSTIKHCILLPLHCLNLLHKTNILHVLMQESVSSSWPGSVYLGSAELVPD